MRKLKAGPIRRLLRGLALRHILKSADEQGMTARLRHHTSHAAYLLHGTPREHYPIYKIDVATRLYTRDGSVEREQVPWVDDISNHLRSDLGRRRELKDAEGLIGPVVVVGPRGSLCFTGSKWPLEEMLPRKQ